MSLYVVSTQYQSPNTKSQLLRKISLRAWAAIFERNALSVLNSPCFLFFAKPLYHNVRIDHRIIFTFFGKQVNIIINYQSGLDLLGFL